MQLIVTKYFEKPRLEQSICLPILRGSHGSPSTAAIVAYLWAGVHTPRGRTALRSAEDDTLRASR